MARMFKWDAKRSPEEEKDKKDDKKKDAKAFAQKYKLVKNA